MAWMSMATVELDDVVKIYPGNVKAVDRFSLDIADTEFVVAGGGNTSVKIDGTLYVKASGFALATIGREGFVGLDRAKVLGILDGDYPREALALK